MSTTSAGILVVLELVLLVLVLAGAAMMFRGGRRKLGLVLGGGALALLLLGEMLPRTGRQSDLAPVLAVYAGWDSGSPPSIGQCALEMYAKGHTALTTEQDALRRLALRGVRLTRFEHVSDSTCACPFQATVQAYTLFGWPVAAVHVNGCDGAPPP